MSVYYVIAPDVGLAKIGYAEHARKRFSKIQSDSPVRLVLAAVEDGGADVEAARHLQFADLRRRGEWFAHEGSLAEHVASLPPLGAKQPSLHARVIAVGISKAHASQIINGKHRPSLPLAVAIWQATGWKCPRIEGATDKELTMIAKVLPWSPRKAA